MAQSEDHLTCTERDCSFFLELICERWHCLSGASGCHFTPPPLSIDAKTPAEGSYPGHWLFSLLCPKSHTPAFWCDCPSQSNLHPSQCSEILPQKTSSGPCHTRSPKFGILTVSMLGYDRTKSALHCFRQANNSETDSMKTVI